MFVRLYDHIDHQLFQLLRHTSTTFPLVFTCCCWFRFCSFSVGFFFINFNLLVVYFFSIGIFFRCFRQISIGLCCFQTVKLFIVLGIATSFLLGFCCRGR
uniref:Uncharacterized protein n=1 Tax=Cacopsylla melanoneura TaxID=428564 RepID=A0A8D8UCS3_9HEMI